VPFVTPDSAFFDAGVAALLASKAGDDPYRIVSAVWTAMFQKFAERAINHGAAYGRAALLWELPDSRDAVSPEVGLEVVVAVFEAMISVPDRSSFRHGQRQVCEHIPSPVQRRKLNLAGHREASAKS
jgi:hypothetical protein